MHARRVTDLDLGEILLRELAAHLDLTAARDPKQRLAARIGDLADFGPAREDRAGDGRDDASTIQARLAFRQQRGRHLDVRRIRHRGGAALFDVLRRQRAGRFDPLRAPILGRRQRRLRLRLLERGREAIDLRNEHRLIELRERLPALHVIAGLHVDRNDPAGLPVVADRHVIARRDRACEGHARGHGLQSRRHDRNERHVALVGERHELRLRVQGAPQHGTDRQRQQHRACRQQPFAAQSRLQRLDRARVRGCGVHRAIGGEAVEPESVAPDPPHGLAVRRKRVWDVFRVRAHAEFLMLRADRIAPVRLLSRPVAVKFKRHPAQFSAGRARGRSAGDGPRRAAAREWCRE